MRAISNVQFESIPHAMNFGAISISIRNICDTVLHYAVKHWRFLDCSVSCKNTYSEKMEMVPEDGYLPRYTSSKSLTKLLVSSFLNVGREMAADSICDVIAKLFCSNERKDFELQKLSQQLSEERSQTQKLQSCIEESHRNADERLRKCHTDVQENSNKIRELEEKYVRSQNSLKKCREQLQLLKEQAEMDREAGIENVKALEILIRDKAEEIEKLIEENSKLQRKLAIIEKNAAENSITSGSYADSSATPVMLEKAVDKARTALTQFSKCLQEHCVSYGGAEEVPGAEIVKGQQRFARPAHSKFAYQHQICQLLFAEFEKEDFDLNGGFCTVLDVKDLSKASFQEYKHYSSAKLEDLRVEVLSTNPENKNFPKFYWEKLKVVVPIHYASLFPASNIPSSNILQDRISSAFLELSQTVWALHKLTFSFQPPARILRFKRFSDYNPACMESFLGTEDNPDFLAKVGLMTMPGFQIRDILIKCKIYPAGKETMA